MGNPGWCKVLSAKMAGNKTFFPLRFPEASKSNMSGKLSSFIVTTVCFRD